MPFFCVCCAGSRKRNFLPGAEDDDGPTQGRPRTKDWVRGNCRCRRLSFAEPQPHLRIGTLWGDSIPTFWSKLENPLAMVTRASGLRHRRIGCHAMTMSPDLTVSDVARELRIRREHVVRLLRSGTLKGYDVTAPGARRKSYRITRRALDDFKTGRTAAQPKSTKRRAQQSRPADFVKYF